jgi:transcriptional regulator with XRE-family HTH domain
MEVKVFDPKKVKQRRIELGMSQAQLSWFTGLSPAYIYSLEKKGINVSASVLYLLSQVLSKPMEYFFSDPSEVEYPQITKRTKLESPLGSSIRDYILSSKNLIPLKTFFDKKIVCELCGFSEENPKINKKYLLDIDPDQLSLKVDQKMGDVNVVFICPFCAKKEGLHTEDSWVFKL